MSDDNPIEKFRSVMREIESAAKNSPEGEFDPDIYVILEDGKEKIRQLDPIVRETMRDKPEKLAKWLQIMEDFERNERESEPLTENEQELVEDARRRRREELLAQEMQRKLEFVSGSLEFYIQRGIADDEAIVELEEAFAEFRELDVKMREHRSEERRVGKECRSRWS